MVTEQLPESSVQPKLPGASAPAGSVGQPVLLFVVCRKSTWSSEAAGNEFGGYGGGCANVVPRLVSLSQVQAENVTANVVALDGAPHSACAQAYTVLPR